MMQTESKKLQLFLWLLAIVPIVLILITEANKTLLIWHIRIVDFIDLLFLAPFYAFICLAITNLVVERKQSCPFWAAIAFNVLLLYGHSMHVTANAINTYSTEINDYRLILPDDVYALIYFFDEFLGHWLYYIGLFGTLTIWTLVNRISCQKSIGGLLNGLILGLFLAVSLIESSQPVIIAIAVFVLAAVIIIKSRQSPPGAIKKDVLVNFTITLFIGLILGTIIYRVITGGFVEPSELLITSVWIR